jgi:two-component system LytT family response regulator
LEGEITARLRVVVADDERPARSFLVALLRSFKDVVIVGEADSGKAAVALIERERPDLALLDLQMPELDGIGVVRMLKQQMPLIAFVTAFDEYAVRAFEINAVDYLLKPVDKKRLRETLNRAIERVEHAEIIAEQASRVGAAIDAYETAAAKPSYLERIPVRQREEVLIVPVNQIASIVAEGELLTITTIRNEHHTITYRLKDLEARLDPAKFVRLGRGTLANVELITKVTLMPGGLHVAILGNGQKLQVSRVQSRALRDRLLKL